MPRKTISDTRAGPRATMLARERELHQRLRRFTTRSSRRITSPLNVGAALVALSQDTNALLGADVTSIWLHDRRARELVLGGSSSVERGEAIERVPAGDPAAPAARGLRLNRPRVLTRFSHAVMVAPLRGWRRALGTLVVEGPLLEDLDPEQRSYFVHEVASQLSVVLENLQLLEQTLAQRRLLENTFNALVDLVIVTDNELRIVDTNDAFASRLGLRRRELVERALADLIEDETFDRITSQAGSVRADGANQPQTFEAPLGGGKFAMTVTPLVDEAGGATGRVIVARDISLQAKLEAERESLRERLAQSEKLASLGQFVAGIAHEMNNPLQGVLGHLELMLRRTNGVPASRPELRRVYQDARRAARIVRNLLIFSGTRPIRRRRLQIKRVWNRAIGSRQAALAGARIDVFRHEHPSVPPVQGDPVLLQEAFLNVLLNAEQAIEEGGHGGRIDVSIGVSGDGERVVATVHDSGPGIPTEALPRIFDPFFTTKEVGKGTGLGLAITYGILHEHGGSIRAENAPEGGAIVTVELPASPRPETTRD
jgi:two-component system, NtrC family, sensor kinase